MASLSLPVITWIEFAPTCRDHPPRKEPSSSLSDWQITWVNDTHAWWFKHIVWLETITLEIIEVNCKKTRWFLSIGVSDILCQILFGRLSPLFTETVEKYSRILFWDMKTQSGCLHHQSYNWIKSFVFGNFNVQIEQATFVYYQTTININKTMPWHKMSELHSNM